MILNMRISLKKLNRQDFWLTWTNSGNFNWISRKFAFAPDIWSIQPTFLSPRVTNNEFSNDHRFSQLVTQIPASRTKARDIDRASRLTIIRGDAVQVIVGGGRRSGRFATRVLSGDNLAPQEEEEEVGGKRRYSEWVPAACAYYVPRDDFPSLDPPRSPRRATRHVCRKKEERKKGGRRANA